MKNNFTVTFFSNFLLHHQTPFCEAMIKRIGDGFRFVATEPTPDERLNMGYRDYSDVSSAARENAEFLEQAMAAAGFVGYSGEWWHFSDAASYPYEDLEQPHFSLNRQVTYAPDCKEYISLRAAPDYDAEVLARVPRGTVFYILGWFGDFARIEYQSQQGYVAKEYIQFYYP